MSIPRTLASVVLRHKKKGFANIIYGPRRVGKTVLLWQIAEKLKGSTHLFLNGDTKEARESLGTTSETALTGLVGSKEVIFIDEAQRIENVGLSLKILIDKFPEKLFFVTGSSSLALSRGLQETLTGRAIKYRLYPLSTSEINTGVEDYKKRFSLESQLVYGGYPYLTSLNTNKEKQDYLSSIVEDYLFRDVLSLKSIESPETLRKLTTLLAYQIGSVVSLNELSRNLGIDVKTVRRYLSLLKQSFIIFELGTFSKNLRKELAKSKKYYFWDLGIRNALTGQLLPLDSRTDIGALWENFLAVERLKKHEYQREAVKHYFWRTYEKAEIDWIETEADKLSAFEFKWQAKKARTPKSFRDSYGTEVVGISKENYLEFVA